MWELRSLYFSCSLGMSYNDCLGSVDRGAVGEDEFRGGKRRWEVPLVFFWYLLPLPRLFPEIQGWEDLWRARVQSSPQRRVSSGWDVQGFLKLDFSVSREGDPSTISQGDRFGNESLPWQSFSFPLVGVSLDASWRQLLVLCAEPEPGYPWTSAPSLSLLKAANPSPLSLSCSMENIPVPLSPKFWDLDLKIK